MYQAYKQTYGVKEPLKFHIWGAVIAVGVIGYGLGTMCSGGSRGGHLQPPTIEDRMH